MKKVLLPFLLFIIIFTSSCSTLEKNNNENSLKTNSEEPVIAIWINYKEIEELINKSDNFTEFEDNIQNIILRLREYHINTIYLQVRAFDDCFYRSENVPVSTYCVNEENELKFDVLKSFIKICHKESIQIHAWINPYRIRNDNNLEKVKDGFAGDILSENANSEKIIVTKNNIYYNPAYIEIQKYILNCIKEIIENYEIDGIHIDDYFYPTTDDKIDNIIYNEYVKNGGVLSKSSYRRQCINSLIASIYSLSKNSNILFSISPNADIEKNYSDYYADVALWTNDLDYADLIIPQLYFGYENEKMPYDFLIDKWCNLKNNDKIVIGLAMYKINKEDIYAGIGKDEWINNKSIISNQIIDAMKHNAGGISFYSLSSLLNEYEKDEMKEEKNEIIDIINNWIYYVT